jgi:lysozyme
MKPTKISPNGLKILTAASNDSLRLNAYLCPSNMLTIGYGHVLQPFYDYPLFPPLSASSVTRIIKECQKARRLTAEAKRLHISVAEAEKLLERDTGQASAFINSVVRQTLNQNQFDALVSFVFNTGQKAFADSQLKARINEGRFDLAAAEFDKWVYGTVNGKKQKLKGLVTRRRAERTLFETPYEPF